MKNPASRLARRASNRASAANRWGILTLANMLAKGLRKLLSDLRHLEDDELTEDVANVIGNEIHEQSIFLDIWRDEVTKLPGRRNLYRHFEEIIASGEDVALLYIDFNDFKLVNDRHDHAIGDRVLAEIGRRLNENVSRKRRGDYVARVGGDEFVVVWAHPGKEMHAIEASIRLWRAVCLEPIVVDGKSFKIRFSGGVVWLPEDEVHPDCMAFMLERAEFAMREIKKKRYDDEQPQVIRFSESLWLDSVEHTKRQRELQDAVDQGKLEVRFQPIVDLITNEAIGFEAFPDHKGLVPPGTSRRSFLERIEEMESNNSTHLMWQRLLEESVKFLAETDPGGSLYVSTNVTVDQIASPKFTALPLDLCKIYGIEPSQLVFEVVERKKLTWEESVITGLNQIRVEGFRISLDDFGQGYNTPATLDRFADSLTGVKIDAHFVRAMSEYGHEHRSVLVALTNMAAAFGKEMTAEGIEDNRLLPSLIALGVRAGQGYLWGDKMNFEEAQAFFYNNRAA